MSLHLNAEFARRLEDELGYGYEVTAYSGRGMAGQTCLGIRCEYADEEELEEAISACLSDPEFAPLRGLLGSSSQDALGLGVIVYFPAVPLSRDFDDDPDEDWEEDGED